MKSIAVVGAGIAGRCCALALARAGCAVTLYERGTLSDRTAVSFVAAGMLAPLSEAAAMGAGDRWIYELGRDAVARWRGLIETLPQAVFLADGGSLIGARAADEVEVHELRTQLARVDSAVETRLLNAAGIAELEPALAEGLTLGLHVPGEGAVHGAQALDALGASLCNYAHREACGSVNVCENRAVSAVGAYRVDDDSFDAVVDCRGLGARETLFDLRGVRGELVELHAPGLRVTRVTRVPHARYPVYLVPRGDDRYIVGATALESEDEAPPAVASVLELLGAVYGLSPALRVASVTRLAAGLRPAFFDNAPRVRVAPGILRVNGLFRHGFLLSPAIAVAVRDHLTGVCTPGAAPLFDYAERSA